MGKHICEIEIPWRGNYIGIADDALRVFRRLFEFSDHNVSVTSTLDFRRVFLHVKFVFITNRPCTTTPEQIEVFTTLLLLERGSRR